MSAPQLPQKPRKLIPWFSIWFQPRKTIRYLSENDPTMHFGILIFLLGASNGLMQAFMKKSPLGMDWLELATIAIPAVLFGVFLQWLAWMILSWTYRQMAGFLGGTIRIDQTRAAVLWSQMPGLVSFGLWLFFIFTSRIENPWQPYTTLILWSVSLTLTLWGFIIVGHAMAEANDMRLAGGFLSVVFGNLILMIPMALLILFAVFLPSKSAFMKGKKLQFPEPIAAVFKPNSVQVANVPDERLSGKKSAPALEVLASGIKAKIYMKNGQELQGEVMMNEGSIIYLDTAEGIVNVNKSDIKKAESLSL